MAALQNASFTSPLAQASFAKFANNPSILDEVFSTITGLSGWMIALTVFLGLVLYDQCRYKLYKVSLILGAIIRFSLTPLQVVISGRRVLLWGRRSKHPSLDHSSNL
jgi:hypothetical protein